MRGLASLLTWPAVLLVAGTTARAQGGQPADSPGRNDYRLSTSWLCRPGRPDACTADLTTTIVAADGKVSRESFTPSADPPIDCFYVYPTVSQDSSDNSDMAAGREEVDVVQQQFARFSAVCRPYAPLYRQATLRALRAALAPGAPATAAFRPDRGLAYGDVLDAWNDYLEHDNQGRGVVLIGHSQGSMILIPLIRNVVEASPARARVVSAILLGANLAVPRGRDVGGDFRTISLCRSAGQVGCAIAYASFRSTLPPPANTLFGRARGNSMEAACTNPAALAGGSGALRAYLRADSRPVAAPAAPMQWVAGVPVETPFVSLPGLLTARCASDARASWLEVTVHADSADPRTDDIPGDIGAAGRVAANWGLHLVDVNLAMGNLVEIVRQQALAWAARPASPPGIPRTAGGRPDLNGIWQALGTAHYDLEPHGARAALAMRPGPVVPVPAREVVALGAVGAVPSGGGVVVGGAIPYTPEALVRRRENQENWLARDPEIRCYLPGVPRATYMPFPFQVFQSERAFVIAYEYAGAVRNVYLSDPGPPEVDSWMGQSVGHWEGDTFVVQASGFNDQTWFDRAGNHHSEALKVVERYTMTSPDHIRYEATIEDPRTFTRPWTIRLPLYRRVEADARLGQFKCVEFVEELLYGHLRKSPLKP